MRLGQFRKIVTCLRKVWIYVRNGMDRMLWSIRDLVEMISLRIAACVLFGIAFEARDHLNAYITLPHYKQIPNCEMRSQIWGRSWPKPGPGGKEFKEAPSPVLRYRFGRL